MKPNKKLLGFLALALFVLPLANATLINSTNYFDFNTIETTRFPELTTNWANTLDANSIISDTNNAIAGTYSLRVDTNKAKSNATESIITYDQSGVWDLSSYKRGTASLYFCVDRPSDLNQADGNAVHFRFVQSATKFKDVNFTYTSVTAPCTTLSKAITSDGTIDDWTQIDSILIQWGQKDGTIADFNVYVDAIRLSTPLNSFTYDWFQLAVLALGGVFIVSLFLIGIRNGDPKMVILAAIAAIFIWILFSIGALIIASV